MGQRNKVVPIASAVVLALTLAGCAGGGATATADETLDIAWATSPASIVPSENTNAATRDIGINIWEGLVSYDADFVIQPMLAESWDASDDGRSVTFTLRDGVQFHDGTEMTAADVVASIGYWRARNNSAIRFLGTMTVEADGNDVTLTTEGPAPILELVALPIQPLAIMPASLIEPLAENENVTEYIGTGPYEFDEWKKDQFVTLTRFDDYSALDTESSGYAGAKDADYSELKYWIVPDVSARTSGLQSGTYDAIDQVQPDDIERLEGSGFTVTSANGPWPVVFLNHSQGPMADEKVRQALARSIDLKAVSEATFSNPDLFDLNGALAPEGSAYYTDEGLDGWNTNDPDEGAKLLAESGYSGETVKILTTKDYPQFYNFAIVVQQTLEDLGVASDITVQPWTTLIETRSDPANWDLAFSNYPLSTLPSTIPFLAPTYAGWPDSPEIAAALVQINEATTDDEKAAATAALQQANSDYVGFIKGANEAAVIANAADVDGITFVLGPIYWNAKPTQ